MNLFAVLIDIAMLAIIIITIARYFNRGFFVSLFSFGGTIVAVVLALLLSNPVAEFVFDNFMRGGITARVESSLSDSLPQQSVAVLIEGFTESMPQSLMGNIENPDILGALESLFVDGVEVSSSHIVDTVVAPIMIAVAAAVIFFFIVFVIKLGFGLLEKMFYVVDKIPVASQLNSLLGGAIGIVPAVINVLLVFSAFTLVAMFTSGQIPIINFETLDETVTGDMFDIVLNAVSDFFTA